ncbi:MAG: Asp-tRNA(Asn)/Glu-tRNA(Gln) amidotransferase subunit GatC [Candidatus Paceibacterota bacterium]|jgi:aspartyl-tRNA(Asn)/glutamyl-tRNA(Gln) amidotransferase subunit C
MSQINEEVLKHLFKLARIEEEQSPQRREKLLKDLSKILDYFNELNEVDTSNVEPMSGGTFLSDVFREDGQKSVDDDARGKQRKESVEQFPKKEGDYLKIPPVF